MAIRTQQCIEAIADRLRLPVSLTDIDLNSLCFSPHSDELIDDVRRGSLLRRRTAAWVRDWFASHGVNASLARPTRVEPHPGQQTLGRWVMPVRRDGRTYGLVCVLDPEARCNDTSAELIKDLVDELADLMYSDEMDRNNTASLVHDVLVGTSDVRAVAVAALDRAAGLGSETSVLVVAVSGTTRAKRSPHARSESPGRARRVADPVLQCAAGDHHAFVVPEGLALEPTIEGVLGAAAECCESPVIGIGDAFPLRDCDRSHDQARAAMSVSARLPELGDVVSFNDLGALRFLAGVADSALLMAIDPKMQLLLDSANPFLRDTVQAYLDSGGDAAATSSTLNVHRGTLYYRLRKASTLTGLDLFTGGDRLIAQLSLLADRLANSEDRLGHPRPVQLLDL